MSRRDKKPGAAGHHPAGPLRPPGGSSPQHQVTSVELRAEHYRGLIPHPDHLERVEALQPGATDRLITMAERQLDHRQGLERRFLGFNGWSQILGTIFGGMFLLGALAGGVYLVAQGKDIAGFATMVIGISAVAIAFVRQRAGQQAEREAKKYGEPGDKAGADR